MNTTLIVVMVVGATLAVSGLGIGLVVGYWRGRARGVALAASERPSPELDILAGVGNAILSVQLKVDALCEVVYQQATRIVDTRSFQIGLFDGDDYLIKVWLKDAERLPPQRFEGMADEGITGWVRRTGSGLLVHDFQREWDTLPARPSAYTHQPARSAIFAPLITAGDVLGLIAVQSARPNEFSDEDMRLLTLLANQASGAIRNAQLFEATHERARQLRLINDVVRQITAIQPLPNLFRQIVTLIHDAFGYYAVNIFTRDETSGAIHLKASSREALNLDDFALTLEQGLVGWAATHCKTVLSPNVNEDARYLPSLTFDATRSEICVPLAIQNRVVGVLDVQSDRPDAFGGDDVFMLETLAGQLALAIQEAQTYDAERRQAERIHAMTEVARALVSILNVDDLLDEVVDLVTDHLGYERVRLFLRAGNRLVLRSGGPGGRWAFEKLAYELDGEGLIPWVAREGCSQVSGDVQQNEWYVPGPGLEDTRSELAVPIRIGQHILGVFDIQATTADAFGEDDVTLIQALADTVAIALRNASLFANESRRRMLSETLRELSTVLASSLDLNRVLDGILVGLEHVVDYTVGMILLLDKDAAQYQVSAARGDIAGPDHPAWNETLPADADPARLIDLLHRLALRPDDVPDGPSDSILLTLSVAGEPIGYLGLERIGPETFTPEEREIINTFANQAAIAITNAQLYMAQREEAWVSTALLQVVAATAHATRLDDVLSTVARITPLLVGVEWSAILLANDAHSFRVVEMAGLPSSITDALAGYVLTPLAWPPLAELQRTGQPILLDSTTPTPSDLPIPVSVGQGVLLPLFAKGQVTGLLLIGQRDGAEPMTKRKIELVSAIANQAALAIESAQLFAAQQEEAWVTTALLQVAEAVNTQSDPAQSLETVVRLTPLLVGVERCGILKWNPERHCFTGGPAWGLSPEKRAAFSEIMLTDQDGRFLMQLVASSDPASSGVGADSPMPPMLQKLFESPTLFGLPLIARGHLVGAMLVDHPALGGKIDQRRLNILNGIAHQTALALENARLLADAAAAARIERELDVAQGIQTSFLPHTFPTVPGWDVAGLYRAARQVGGDFYDLFQVDDNRWAIVVADVSDKGVPAALFMALCRTLLRAVGSNRLTPATTLLRVNELLLRDTRTELFVTVWYGLWNAQTGEVQYCSAGHNPPLVLRADGSAELLYARGIALGVVPSIKLEERTLHLAPGDVLVAYTDGVTEALRHDKAEFSVSGLQSAVLALRRKSAQDMAGGILKAIDTFAAGEPQFDDITMVVLKHQMRSPEI